MTNIIEINDEKIWDDFVRANTEDTFLQSWAWGEFNQSFGNKIWRFGLLEESKLLAVFLIIVVKAKRGRFLFLPHGPILNSRLVSQNQLGLDMAPTLFLKKLLSDILKKLIEIAKKEACSFVRVAPVFEDSREIEKMFSDLGLIKAPIHIHSELSWILDISPSEQELLSGMRKTTRYLINQNSKYELRVESSNNPKDIERFYQIYKETEKRQKFMAYDLNYITKEFLAFAKNNEVLIYFSTHKKVVLSCAFIIKYGNSGFYHHGATSNKEPKIPSSYILQWEIIKDLKRHGLKYYNFWGISPEEKASHPWRGLTLFKKGFGGFEKKYIPTHDFTLKPSYWFNWIIESARKIKRRY